LGERRREAGEDHEVGVKLDLLDSVQPSFR
jgi:hypothetical protein